MTTYKISHCVVWFQGMDSGYGDDEAYNVYDQPWRKGQSEIANNIYRPSKNVDKEMYGGDLETIMKSNRYTYCFVLFIFWVKKLRFSLSLYLYILWLYVKSSYFTPRFVPDRGFAGTDRNSRREGPVQFEQEEEDPFGLGQFLEEAKRGDNKRKADDSRSSREYDSSKSKKRRD